ncbi:hypothetical protein MHYP_G00251310 [Metynnis hypsauchen]
MTTRAASVARMWLPAIQHPSSRLAHPDNISVSGCSSLGPSTPLSLVSGSLDTPFRSQSVVRDFRFGMEKGPAARDNQGGHMHRTELPMLEGEVYWEAKGELAASASGQKGAAEGRAVSRVSASTSSIVTEAQLKEQVDQLEDSLKERIQSTGALTLKTMFKHNHPEGKPVASRSVVLLILTKFLRQLITAKQLKLLLQRLQLSDRALVSFDDLYNALRGPDSFTTLSLPMTLTLLRGATRNRFLECVENLTDKESLSQSWISASQLRDILDKLKLRLRSSEFEQLWKRLDTNGIGAVKLTVLLQKLGLDKRSNLHTSNKNNQCSSPSKAQDNNSIPDTPPSMVEEERQASIAMETWLKDRFRAGVQRMKAEFDKRDPDGCGKVSSEDFLQVLATFDLQLKREHLGLFLSRCGVELRKGGVDYTRFLRKFQDRSQDGITHRIISNPQHRFHSMEDIRHGSSVTEVEARLTHLLHAEYLSLLETFQKIDKLNKGIISQEEFRTAVEHRFGLVISDGEFEQLVDRLPLDRLGNVQYGVFMAAFDTRVSYREFLRPFAFQEQACRSGFNMAAALQSHREAGDLPRNVDACSVEALSTRIRKKLSRRKRAVRKACLRLDVSSSGHLSSAELATVLQLCGVCDSPEELGSVFSVLTTDPAGRLDYRPLLLMTAQNDQQHVLHQASRRSM